MPEPNARPEQDFREVVEQHPLPWHCQGPSVYDKYNNSVFIGMAERPEHGFLVHCVNAYPGLVAENERLRAERNQHRNQRWAVSDEYRAEINTLKARIAALEDVAKAAKILSDEFWQCEQDSDHIIQGSLHGDLSDALAVLFPEPDGEAT